MGWLVNLQAYVFAGEIWSFGWLFAGELCVLLFAN